MDEYSLLHLAQVPLTNIETNMLVKVIIGGVKNTSRCKLCDNGIERADRLQHLVKDRKNGYLVGSEVSIQGILCVNELEVKSNLELEIQVVSTSKNVGCTDQLKI